MTYLERYLAGEHERVWNELVALGPAVRDEPVYGDALAVARETMRRVRWNVEVLIPRLKAKWHNTTFVNYLRICFRWAGLPGLERVESPPREDIARLTEGLLPI